MRQRSQSMNSAIEWTGPQNGFFPPGRQVCLFQHGQTFDRRPVKTYLNDIRHLPWTNRFRMSAARFGAPGDCLQRVTFSAPTHRYMSWGKLLQGVRRQQKHHSQHDKQGESVSHGLPLFLACAAQAQCINERKGNRLVQATALFPDFQLLLPYS